MNLRCGTSKRSAIASSSAKWGEVMGSLAADRQTVCARGKSCRAIRVKLAGSR